MRWHKIIKQCWTKLRHFLLFALFCGYAIRLYCWHSMAVVCQSLITKSLLSHQLDGFCSFCVWICRCILSTAHVRINHLETNPECICHDIRNNYDLGYHILHKYWSSSISLWWHVNFNVKNTRSLFILESFMLTLWDYQSLCELYRKVQKLTKMHYLVML